MRKLLFIISAISLIGIATSCKKEFLNTTPLGAYSDASVWVDPNLAAAFVNQCYENAIGYPSVLRGLLIMLMKHPLLPTGCFRL